MVAGAESIDDPNRLGHGEMGRLFSGIRARSTLGRFRRRVTFGHDSTVCTHRQHCFVDSTNSNLRMFANGSR